MQIKVSDLHKSYVDGEGKKLHILKGVNFEADQGSTSAIVGASGTGKSTFLHTLGTLENIDSGSLLVNGQDLGIMSREKAAKFRNEEVGFIFQFHQLLQDFTALENVMMPQMIQEKPQQEAEAKALNILEKVGLADRAGHKPSQLSGGEQQRVAIARAMVNQPKIVLADEPTGNLDEKTGEQVMNNLLQLNQENNTTLIMITHNSKLASEMQFQHRMENGQLNLI